MAPSTLQQPANEGAKRKPATPYQLDLDQTRKACIVVQRNIREAANAKAEKRQKPDLLSGDDSTQAEDSEDFVRTPIWLILTGKKVIADKGRLKPHKVQVPHPLDAKTDSTICLITADPQRLYKDTIASPAFPQHLRTRITRVIGLSKLKAKYKSFEALRHLASEHDFFFADSRTITYLPRVLGKTFYRSNLKRPIPVEISGGPTRGPDGKKIKLEPGAVRKSTKGTDGNGAAKPANLAKEIEKTLNSVAVHLAASNMTSIKIATAAMDASEYVENAQAVVDAVTSRILPGGWRNIRSLHIKGPKTPSFPIWLASELWTEEADVLERKKMPNKKRKVEETNTPSQNGKSADELPPAPNQEVAEEERVERKRKKARSSELRQKMAAQKADVLLAAGSALPLESTAR